MIDYTGKIQEMLRNMVKSSNLPNATVVVMDTKIDGKTIVALVRLRYSSGFLTTFCWLVVRFTDGDWQIPMRNMNGDPLVYEYSHPLAAELAYRALTTIHEG